MEIYNIRSRKVDINTHTHTYQEENELIVFYKRYAIFYINQRTIFRSEIFFLLADRFNYTLRAALGCFLYLDFYVIQFYCE